MTWRIEYTNHPPLKKHRRSLLEREVVKGIERVEGLLRHREDDGFLFEEENFAVESVWVEALKKHHVAVRDFKHDDRWVASVVFENHPTLTVEQVESHLENLGLNKNSLYGLGVTNEQTVGMFLAELEENLQKADREEWAKKFDLINIKFLEGFLEQGVIEMSDGLLDAFKKIEHTT